MKILFLSPRLPWPLDTGGKIRTFNILKQLSLEHDVHLVCFSFDQKDALFIKEFEALNIRTSLVPFKECSFLIKVFTVLFNQMPFSIVKYFKNSMVKKIKDILDSEQFNAVHIDHLHMAHYRDLFEKTPVFLDEHNVEYKILERCAKVETSLIKKFLYINQTYKMRVVEAAFAKQFTGIFACSLDDQLMLSKLTIGLTPTYVIPNGVDTNYFQLDQQVHKEHGMLLFTGSMDWLPNDDGITYFCDEILPLIWKQNPSVKLYVVGKNPSISVKELSERDKRVVVTGRVDDVRPYMLRAHLFIVPLRIGGGTRLKILEAMAMKKAIISTSIGAEGIEYKKGENIALGDTPEQFANEVFRLLNDAKALTAMEENGRQLVCQKYDWSIIGKTITGIYQQHARQ